MLGMQALSRHIGQQVQAFTGHLAGTSLLHCIDTGIWMQASNTYMDPQNINRMHVNAILGGNNAAVVLSRQQLLLMWLLCTTVVSSAELTSCLSTLAS
jgi:hypothetical protein